MRLQSKRTKTNNLKWAVLKMEFGRKKIESECQNIQYIIH